MGGQGLYALSGQGVEGSGSGSLRRGSGRIRPPLSFLAVKLWRLTVHPLLCSRRERHKPETPKTFRRQGAALLRDPAGTGTHRRRTSVPPTLIPTFLLSRIRTIEIPPPARNLHAHIRGNPVALVFKNQRPEPARKRFRFLFSRERRSYETRVQD